MGSRLFSLVLAAAAVIAMRFSCIGTANAMVSSKKHGTTAMVRATYHNYLPEKIQWNFLEANTYCSTWDANRPLAWRKEFGWTSFCGPVGPNGPASCGKCLLLKNADTGATTKARIVDQCSNGGLDLDYHVFRSLDSDGNGMNQGHLNVIYQFIPC